MPRGRSNWDTWYPPPSRPRPVEGGIKAKSQRGTIGATWWSRRFLELLEALGLGGRLDRGKRYARQGQVVSLDVEPGGVTARVQGSRARPYRVWIGVAQLSEGDWRRAEEAMAARARFAAKLLAGEMPQDIEDAFAACSLSLFPTSLADLETDCSCPDWANPCKHIAAAYYLLGEAFDDDPFLILRWRGRDREELLANLRALRGGTGRGAPAEDVPDAWADVESVEAPPLDADVAGFWGAADLAGALHGGTAHADAAAPDAVLRELDPLDVEAAGKPAVDWLRPAYATIAAAARDRLLGEDQRSNG